MHTSTRPIRSPRPVFRLGAGLTFTLALLSAACGDPTAPVDLTSLDAPAFSLENSQSSFAVLANAAVTCTDGTITGDVGTFLAEPTGSVTQTSCPITGTVHVGDPAAIAAYDAFLDRYAAFAPDPAEACTVLTGTLAGATLPPGVYCFDAAAALTGVLTLDGPAGATWTFKIGTVGTGALTGTNFSVVMAGGGQACDVTWWVAQAVTMTDSDFLGSILAGAAITLTRGTFGGNAWSQADVTITGTTTTGCGELPPVEPPVEPPVDDDCQNCSGGVTELTLRNDGPMGNVLVTDKDGGVLFDGTVAAGAEFSFQGLGSDGKMGTEITITTDAGTIKVHTSCSQPIGLGSVLGDFTVTAGSSKDGGALSAPGPKCGKSGKSDKSKKSKKSKKSDKSGEDCQICSGGVTELTLQYAGPTGNVLVTDKDGGVLFDGIVEAGTEFSFQGLGNEGKMGTRITITTDAGTIEVHTSCSQPIGVGTVFGDFTVTGGASKDGGALSEGGEECSKSKKDDKPKSKKGRS